MCFEFVAVYISHEVWCIFNKAVFLFKDCCMMYYITIMFMLCCSHFCSFSSFVHFSRTRYIHTELGIRERLLVGVLTSRATLNTLAVAVNRTVAHHFHRTFFFTGLRSPKVPHGMTVVAHGDDRPVWLMYETVRHLHEHYGSDYDWFLLAQDDTYMQADRLCELVGHLSAGQDLYMGRAEEFIGGEEKARYCHGGYGYLLSRSLLARLQPHLDTCRNDILSVRPDEWLGRCIIDYLGLSCVEVHQVQKPRLMHGHLLKHA